MITVNKIREKLLSLNAKFLDVIDESHLHAGHKGNTGIGLTHIKIIISGDFIDGSLIQKHRIINEALKEELRNGLHSVSIKLCNI